MLSSKPNGGSFSFQKLRPLAEAISNSLIEFSRWLFLCALFCAPWAYGCTPEWAIALLNAGCGLIFALWLMGRVAVWKSPRFNRVTVVCVMWLLVQGWLMALNAHFRHDPTDRIFQPVPSWWGNGPGTVDNPVSVMMMWRVTALLGMLLYVGDLAQRSVWRRRIRQTIMIAGASVVLFGITERAFGAHAIFWTGKPTTSLFFATYYYSGNAGAFINLVLPIAAGAAWCAHRGNCSGAERALALPTLCICLAGAFINASRAAFAIMCVLALACAVWMRRSSIPTIRWNWVRALSAILSILAVGAIISSAGWQMAAQKWTLLPQQLSADNPRLLAASACVKMLPDAGFWGFGPGTFEIAFPHYTHFLGASIAGIWRFAHNDYLQTVLEWGWLGAIAWAVLFFRGMSVCFFRSIDSARSYEERCLLFSIGLALAGIALHATVDFPLQIASLQLYVVTCLGMSGLIGQPFAESHGRAVHCGVRPAGHEMRRPQTRLLMSDSQTGLFLPKIIRIFPTAGAEPQFI